MAHPTKVNLVILSALIKLYKKTPTQGTMDTIMFNLDCLPSGSGFDDGTKLNIDRSSEFKIVFDTAFHHMVNGSYTRWTYHRVVVTPTFGGFDMKVLGPNHLNIKDYIYDTFDTIFEI